MRKRWRRRIECEVCEGRGGEQEVICGVCEGEGKVDMAREDDLRDALAELAQAATWVANQPDPREAMAGYSWYNVAQEQVAEIRREAMQQGGAF